MKYLLTMAELSAIKHLGKLPHSENAPKIFLTSEKKDIEHCRESLAKLGLTEPDGGINLTGKLLSESIFTPDFYTKTLCTSSLFGEVWYLKGGGGYTVLALNCVQEIAAIITAMTKEECKEFAKKDLLPSELPEFSSFETELSSCEIFLLLLILQQETADTSPIIFTKLFKPEQFSLLSYSKDYVIPAKDWSEFKKKLGKKEFWHKALKSLSEKGLIKAENEKDIIITELCEKYFHPKNLIRKLLIESGSKKGCFHVLKDTLLQIEPIENGLKFTAVNDLNMDIYFT